MGNVTFIGSTRDTVVRRVLTLIRSPICAIAIPAIPSIGDFTCVHSKLSSACLTAARAGRHGGLVATVGLNRVVKFLLANRPFLRQRRITRHVEASLAQRRLSPS